MDNLLSEPQINEVCKAIVYGRTFEDISTIMQIPIDVVKEISANESERIAQLKQYYSEMEVI